MTPRGWVVEIVESATGEVVKTLGPYDTERTAEKTERGVETNLNHAKYHTNVAMNSARSQKRIEAVLPEAPMKDYPRNRAERRREGKP